MLVKSSYFWFQATTMVRFLISFLFLAGSGILTAQVEDTLLYEVHAVDPIKLQQLKMKQLKREIESAKKSGEENQALMDRLKKENEKLKVILQQYNEQVEQPKKDTVSNAAANQIPPMVIRGNDKDTGAFKYVSNKAFLNEMHLKTAETIQMINEFLNESDRKRLNKNGE